MIRVEIDNYQPSQALLERHAAVMDLYWKALDRKPVERESTMERFVKTAGKLEIGDIVEIGPISGDFTDKSLDVITNTKKDGYNITISTLCEVTVTVDIGLMCGVLG